MQKTKLLSPIIGLVAFAVIFSACQSNTTPATDTTPNETQQEITVEPTGAVMEKEESTETDETSMEAAEGETITLKETYQSPAGPEEVGFTIVVDENGVITDAKTEQLAKAPISKVRQEAFAKDMPAAIKGKKLSELTKVDRIGGSSLTTGAFNAFLEKAKKQV